MAKGKNGGIREKQPGVFQKMAALNADLANVRVTLGRRHFVAT